MKIKKQYQCTNKTEQKQTHRYREQTASCQRREVKGIDGKGEGDEEVQTCKYKISHGDVIYSIGNRVNIIITMYVGRWLLNLLW